MLSIEIMKEKLQSSLSPSRFIHTLGVVDTATELAKQYSVDIEKAQVAALLHDCAKDFPKDMKKRLCKEYHIFLDDIMAKEIELVHSSLGAEVAKREYGVQDEEILNAIRYHTTGRPEMGILEKIIFLADYIEPNRIMHKGLKEVRALTCQSIDKGLLMALDNTIEYVKKKDTVLHPLTLNAKKSLEQRMKDDI